MWPTDCIYSGPPSFATTRQLCILNLLESLFLFYEKPMLYISTRSNNTFIGPDNDEQCLAQAFVMHSLFCHCSLSSPKPATEKTAASTTSTASSRLCFQPLPEELLIFHMLRSCEFCLQLCLLSTKC